jgi:YD repeat-containing protein
MYVISLFNKSVAFRASLRIIKMNSRNIVLFLHFSILASLGFFSVLTFAAVQEDFIAPSKYSTVDALGVNVFGLQVAPSLETISMGGAMGLSHSITLQGNLFTFNHGSHGYTDKYAGGLKYTELGRKMPLITNGPLYDPLWALSATAMGDSVQFIQKCNGLFVDDLSNSCTTAQKATAPFEAVHDKRHTLGVKGSNVVWTKPDGTEVYFPGSTLVRGSSGPVLKIVYPNGFTINTASAYSVTTNTGFQLKYDFVVDNRGLETSKVGRLPTHPSVALSDSTQWWSKNPKYIRAINNAYEYCDQQAPCNLTNPWPTVTFDWPGGMPRAFYIDTSVFRVTNSVGATAEYQYQSQDAVIMENGQALPGYAINTIMAPRLIAIKPYGASQPTLEYTYKNKFRPGTNGSGSWVNPDDPGILTSAKGMKDSSGGMRVSSGYSSGRYQNNYGGDFFGYLTQVNIIDYYPTILEKVTLTNGDRRTITFETENQRNFVTSDVSFASAKSYQYFADSNNVNIVTNRATGTYEAGGYPASCVNPTPDRNRKTCNQPGWVKHNGVMTSYIYHEPSGQVQRVTSPPDKNGISAVVRYGYEQKFARYIQTPGGAKATAPNGIWLKTSEKRCNNTATLGDACAGNATIPANQDEVVTTFEYNHDNLLLTGMTVTVVDNNNVAQVQRTCYQYDMFGNRIGETQPKALRTSCTQ